jgi:hypothetical protein
MLRSRCIWTTTEAKHNCAGLETASAGSYLDFLLALQSRYSKNHSRREFHMSSQVDDLETDDDHVGRKAVKLQLLAEVMMPHQRFPTKY